MKLGFKTNNNNSKPLKLSDILQDPSKHQFIIPNQSINLNSSFIEEIDIINKNKYGKIKKLFLSHNKIRQLKNIDQFEQLEHLSLGFNKIQSINQILNLKNKQKIKYLMVQGNPFEEQDPDWFYQILINYVNIKVLNDQKISENLRQSLLISKQMIERKYITVLYILSHYENTLRIMVNKLEMIDEDKIIDIMQLFKSFNMSNDKKSIYNVEYLHIKQICEFFQLNSKYLNHYQNDNPYLFAELKYINQNLKLIFDMIYKMQNKQIVINDLQGIQATYEEFFNNLILRLGQKNDKKLEKYLLNKAIENPNLDHNKFDKDCQYAYNFIKFEFYKLKPVQAEIGGTICLDNKLKSEGYKTQLEPIGIVQSKQILSQNIFTRCMQGKNQQKHPLFSNLHSDSSNYRAHKQMIEVRKEQRGKQYLQGEIINQPEEMEFNCPLHIPVFIMNENYMGVVFEIVIKKIVGIKEYFQSIEEKIKEINGKKVRKLPYQNLLNRQKCKKSKSLGNKQEDKKERQRNYSQRLRQSNYDRVLQKQQQQQQNLNPQKIYKPSLIINDKQEPITFKDMEKQLRNIQKLIGVIENIKANKGKRRLFEKIRNIKRMSKGFDRLESVIENTNRGLMYQSYTEIKIKAKQNQLLDYYIYDQNQIFMKKLFQMLKNNWLRNRFQYQKAVQFHQNILKQKFFLGMLIYVDQKQSNALELEGIFNRIQKYNLKYSFHKMLTYVEEMKKNEFKRKMLKQKQNELLQQMKKNHQKQQKKLDDKLDNTQIKYQKDGFSQANIQQDLKQTQNLTRQNIDNHQFQSYSPSHFQSTQKDEFQQTKDYQDNYNQCIQTDKELYQQEYKQEIQNFNDKQVNFNDQFIQTEAQQKKKIKQKKDFQYKQNQTDHSFINENELQEFQDQLYLKSKEEQRQLNALKQKNQQIQDMKNKQLKLNSHDLKKCYFRKCTQCLYNMKKT